MLKYETVQVMYRLRQNSSVLACNSNDVDETLQRTDCSLSRIIYRNRGICRGSCVIPVLRERDFSKNAQSTTFTSTSLYGSLTTSPTPPQPISALSRKIQAVFFFFGLKELVGHYFFSCVDRSTFFSLMHYLTWQNTTDVAFYGLDLPTSSGITGIRGAKASVSPPR